MVELQAHVDSIGLGNLLNTGSNVPQPIMNTFDGEPIEFTLFVEPVGFDNCQATDVMLVEPGFSFEVEQQQPSCFANDGIIGEVCLRTPLPRRDRSPSNST